ncbi:hypothetical protein Vi05172_g5052 [Venturia inaequalis]|uniref:Nascent polypeptide-associated complex subunit alpha-like UBA domain-containing protein n=1 Tax=Venturia inaequalis TaxID=5025 RepID=A0A8H3YX39_VENIN|nr:hypothetical protein EG327_009330 [Venturia inaequalis]RDI84912.1 hypothetical protein Vi05172_g5052 [Venturia inaequalis]
MAEEPQPDTLVEGVTEESTLPTNAEDRKAAAALSALDARGDDDEETSEKKDVDTAALDKAMKNLDVKASKADVYKGKIDAADVNLVVSELELTKLKATELLRAHEGDAVKAIVAYVTAPV